MHTPAITALITIRQQAEFYLRDLNFLSFGGKPLYQHVIDTVLQVKNINYIAVITDSEVVKTALKNNLRVLLIDYPEHLASNEYELPTSDKVTEHALQYADGEHFIQLQTATPLLTQQSLAEAIHMYYQFVLNEPSKQWEHVMSLQRVEKKLFTLDYPKAMLREDPAFVIFEDTVLNVFNKTAFRRSGNSKFTGRPMMFETPEIERLAVETPHSYQQAKLILENRALFASTFEREAYLPTWE